MYDFEQDGFSYHEGVCAGDELAQFEDALQDILPEAAGTRLFGVSAIADMLFADGCVGKIAQHLMPDKPQPVRAILFDKSGANNWSLGWHQDRTIVVKRRIETGGFGPWTTKAGLQHVVPPVAILESMVTLRLHLDPVSSDNAPLLVAKSSHLLGRVAEPNIQSVVQVSTIVECLAERGDIWAYSTLILHASEPSRKVAHRRVLQVDYAASDLPGDLEWLGII